MDAFLALLFLGASEEFRLWGPAGFGDGAEGGDAVGQFAEEGERLLMAGPWEPPVASYGESGA